MNFLFQLGGERGTFSEKSLPEPEGDKRAVQRVNKSVKTKDHVEKMPFTWLGGVQVALTNNTQPQNSSGEKPSLSTESHNCQGWKGP